MSTKTLKELGLDQYNPYAVARVAQERADRVAIKAHARIAVVEEGIAAAIENHAKDATDQDKQGAKTRQDIITAHRTVAEESRAFATAHAQNLLQSRGKSFPEIPEDLPQAVETAMGMLPAEFSLDASEELRLLDDSTRFLRIVDIAKGSQLDEG